MNGQGLANTSSPKLTVPQVSEQASGPASRTASRSAKLSVTAPPVESCTMRSVPSRSAATVSASLPRSSVGRAASSLMCTWMTAAPAASHSLAVVTSSSRVTGSAGTTALSASAPVGATVIRVPAMAARLPSPGSAYAPPIYPSPDLRWRGPARGQRQVLPGERQRLRQVRDAAGPRRDAVGLDLDHDRAVVSGRDEAAEEFGAWLVAAARHQVLVRDGSGRVARAVGQVHVGQAAAQLGGHGQGVGTR